MDEPRFSIDQDWLVRIRRELHAHPEIGWELENTVRVVRRELDDGADIALAGEIYYLAVRPAQTQHRKARPLLPVELFKRGGKLLMLRICARLVDDLKRAQKHLVRGERSGLLPLKSI